MNIEWAACISHDKRQHVPNISLYCLIFFLFFNVFQVIEVAFLLLYFLSSLSSSLLFYFCCHSLCHDYVSNIFAFKFRECVFYFSSFYTATDIPVEHSCCCWCFSFFVRLYTFDILIMCCLAMPSLDEFETVGTSTHTHTHTCFYSLSLIVRHTVLLYVQYFIRCIVVIWFCYLAIVVRVPIRCGASERVCMALVKDNNLAENITTVDWNRLRGKLFCWFVTFYCSEFVNTRIVLQRGGNGNININSNSSNNNNNK